MGPRKKLIALASFLLVRSAEAHGKAPEIWLADDGARIGPSTSPPSRVTSERSAQLFALRGETVAFQVGIRAGDETLEGVEVNIQIASPSGRTIPDWLSIDRFVVFSIPAPGRTRNGWTADETLGWASLKAMPPLADSVIPDALVPIEHAPSWAPYPLRIAANTTASVWFDLFVSDEAPPMSQDMVIRITEGERVLRDVPVQLDVKASKLPFRAIKTAVFYDPKTLRERIGTTEAEVNLWQLLHRHHLTPMLSADDDDDLDRVRAAMSGSAYLLGSGYRGPGENIGDDLVVLGTYGSLGEPTPASLTRVTRMTHALTSSSEARFVFLYAIDERCDSDRAARWRRALRSSGDPLLAALRVGETCHIRAPSRAADLVMVPSAAFRWEEAEEARAAGQWHWVYNGQRPRSGPLMLDAASVDLRVNGWIASTFPIDRWFYWESTFWNDINSGGQGPIDPFATAETFHNASGDTALGDGILVYPGRQVGFDEHSMGVDRLVPSIRLKNLRRGIQDAGYVALVASRDSELAERIVRSVVPFALDEVANDRVSPSWCQDSSHFLEARRSLWDRIPSGLALDDKTLKSSLDEVSSVRKRAVDRSTQAPAARFAVGIVAGAAATLLARRAKPRFSRTTRKPSQ